MPEQVLRVLHITASSMIGGGPEHVWQLVRHFPENIESFVAAPNCEPYGPRFVGAVGQERFLCIPQRKFTIRSLVKLVVFVKRNKIDMIHSHGKGAGVYGRLVALVTGIKSVHSFHGIHLPEGKVFTCLYRRLERFLCNISKVCIAVSNGEREIAKNAQFFPQKLLTIHNGVFVPEKLEHRDMPVPFTLLHVSRFDHVKNSPFLYDIALELQARGLLKLCKFVLVGDGEELPLLKHKVHAAGLEESFQIHGQQNFMETFYEQAACLISTSYREGMPLAVLEAEAYGVPAIVSDVVGNKDAVEANKTGFLFPVEDARIAVDCIEMFLRDAELWQQMRKNAYAYVKENFGVQKMADATAKLYREG